VTSESERPILIAGAGPVGVIAALALARQGLAVHVLEARDRVDDSPRAATTHAATLEMFAGLGLIDEVPSHISVPVERSRPRRCRVPSGLVHARCGTAEDCGLPLHRFAANHPCAPRPPPS
jgi:2-polyprenyl-6-methoxyphenol hydroxylase-like FAD-dependent oxidoreductase